MTRPFYTLTENDVGRAAVRAFGKVWMASTFIGRVLPGDVGKRVYQVGDIVQVENDQQRDARLASPREE